MKKSIKAILFSLISLVGFAQDEVYKLPEMALPSPQAFEITKYGDTPVDESSGRISPSIPLHNYTVGQLSIPISLSYSGGGVKVSQNPTWTGVSWNLNAGGVISRVVKDLPDETSLPRYFYSETELEAAKSYYEIWSEGNDDPFNPSDPYLIESGYRLTQEIVNNLKNNNNNDTQVDEFNFSFGNYSGSFYLIKESGIWRAKQAKHNSELKIEILGNFNLTDNYEFKITTPDGVMYYFGGLAGGLGSTTLAYAVEETQLLDRSVTPFKAGIKSKTAFYLTKVENTIGDYIFLEYETIQQYEILSAREQKLFNLITANIGICSVNDGIQNNTILNNRPIRNTVFNGKYLKRIWSPLGSSSIVFNSFNVMETLQGGGQNLKYRVLTDIVLENKTVNFQYYPESENLVSGSKDKFFLTDVVFKDLNNQIESEKYKFEYKNIQMAPGQFSNSQDYLGYYNGKSNPSLLPKKTSFLLANYLSAYQTPGNENQLNSILQLSDFNNYQHILGDRDPDFQYATVGILKKIIYPTGGFTEFEYEPVEKKIIKAGLNLQVHSNMGNSTYVNPAWFPYSKLSTLSGISSTFVTEDGGPGENVFVSQSVKVDVDINTILTTGLDYHDYIYVQFKNVNTNSVVEKKYYFPNTVMSFDNSQTNFTTSFVFGLVENHGYEIKVGFGDQYAGKITPSNKEHFSNTPMYVNVSFEYIKGYDENDGLGIRIKRVKDFESDNALPLIKRYYYSTIKDVYTNESNNSEVKVYSPLFHNFHVTTVECPPDVELGYDHPTSINRYYLTLNSNSFNQNLPSSDVPSLYKNVSISYGGDNFENGGIEKAFFIKKDKNQKHYNPNTGVYVNLYFWLMTQFMELDISNKTNEGVINGLLLKEDIWKRKNSVLYKVKKNIYEYANHEELGANNINIIKFLECNYCADYKLNNLFLGLYSTNTYKPLLTNKKEISFIEEISLSRYIPPVRERGWQNGDHDGDGILNASDEDYLNYTEAYIESNYKKVINTVNYDYFLPIMPELPTLVTTTNSDGEVSIVRNFYPIAQDINALSNELTANEILTYEVLKNENRISKPIQVNTSNNTELLSKLRFVYQFVDHISSTVFLHKVKSAKANAHLEDRVIYHKYDERGNPIEISQEKGTKVIYIWSFQRKPLYKIVNATYSQVASALSGSGILIDENFIGGPSNYLINALPNAQITSFFYTPISNLLSQVTDQNGKSTYYEYDEFDRLKLIKDDEGNILSENKQNYKPQN